MRITIVIPRYDASETSRMALSLADFARPHTDGVSILSLRKPGKHALHAYWDQRVAKVCDKHLWRETQRADQWVWFLPAPKIVRLIRSHTPAKHYLVPRWQEMPLKHLASITKAYHGVLCSCDAMREAWVSTCVGAKSPLTLTWMPPFLGSKPISLGRRLLVVADAAMIASSFSKLTYVLGDLLGRHSELSITLATLASCSREESVNIQFLAKALPRFTWVDRPAYDSLSALLYSHDALVYAVLKPSHGMLASEAACRGASVVHFDANPVRGILLPGRHTIPCEDRPDFLDAPHIRFPVAAFMERMRDLVSSGAMWVQKLPTRRIKEQLSLFRRFWLASWNWEAYD